MAESVPSLKQVGSRLRDAREALGYPTRVVARELTRRGFPVSHATVANYESGRTVPGIPTIQALASFYDKPVEWFLGSGPALRGVRYRCLKAVKLSEKRAFEGETAGWFQAYIELESAVEASLRSQLSVNRTHESGAELAERVRGLLGLSPLQPVPSVIQVLERFGVRAIQIWSEARIDALAAHFGDMPIVALNATLSNDRLRFDAGHELWHVLAGECDEDIDLSDKELDGPAHEFASHLLLTDEALREAFVGSSMVRLVQFKERYGISLAAMIYRARSAGIIRETLYERLWREFSRLGWRKQEPGYVPPDRPTRLEELIDTAVKDRRCVTFTDIARYAGVSEAAVRQRWLIAMGGGPHDEPKVEGAGPFQMPSGGERRPR